MKRRYIKASNYILGLLLSALGFTSCDNEEGFGGGPDMYGCPSADYKISGRVTDVDGNPIKEIEVSASYGVTQTDKDGNYSLNIDSASPTDLKIGFIDVDGEVNGEYETKEVLEKFDSSDYVGGDDSWYYGKATRTVNIKLTEKLNTEE